MQAHCVLNNIHSIQTKQFAIFNIMFITTASSCSDDIVPGSGDIPHPLVRLDRVTHSLRSKNF